MMKNILLLVVSTLSLTLAQNTYAECLMNSTDSLNLATGASNNFFCSENRCFNTDRTNATFICINRYSRELVVNKAISFTHNQDITITELERISVPITNVPTIEGWLQLKRGQSARVGFFNKAEKSAYVDLVFRPGTNRSSANQRLGFYVYNKATQEKLFDMTEA